MIIDTNKEFSQQTEEVQQAIKDELQLEIIHRNQSGEGYPSFDDDGGITISINYTDDTGNSFKLSEKREQIHPFSEKNRGVNNKYYKIEKL